MLEHKRHAILEDVHEGIIGAHNAGEAIVRKVLRGRLWWPALFHDARKYCKCCDVYQKIGKPSRKEKLPLFLVTALNCLRNRK